MTLLLLELTTTPWAEKTRLDSYIDGSTHGGDVVTASALLPSRREKTMKSVSRAIAYIDNTASGTDE